MAAVYIVVTLVALAFLWLWRSQNSRQRKLINLIPGPPTLPFIGNGHLIKPGGVDFYDRVNEWASTYGKDGIFRLWIGTNPMVYLCKASTAETLVSSTSPAVASKSLEYEFLRPWLNDGLLVSKGDKWFHRRRMITPTFHFQILSDFLIVMYEHSQILMDKLEKNGNKSIDIYKVLGLSALDVICESAMGVTVDAQSHSDSEYVEAVKVMGVAVIDRIANPLIRPDWVFKLTSQGRKSSSALKVLHSFTNKVIEERDAELSRLLTESGWKVSEDDLTAAKVMQVCKRKRLALLDMLLVASRVEGSDLSHAAIQEEVDTFMFEGHDTTSAAMSWALYCIGSHPDAQDKVVDEIRQVFGGVMRQPTAADMSKLKYLDSVLRESQRLFPTVAQFGRNVTSDFSVGGHTVPPGTSLMVWTPSLHQDPAHFPDPMRFDPGRWMNESARHPYSFIPFSAGARNCVGQKFALYEMKTTISCILSRYHVKSVQSRDQLIQSTEMILKPLGDGILLQLEPRD